MRQGTLCYITDKQADQQKLLLAFKKRGWGAGKWCGTGGKVKSGESIEEATIRETEEEVGIRPVNLKKMAILTFLWPDVPNKEMDMEVHVYFAQKFRGQPQETEEMKPQWFWEKELPFKKMWPSDSYWLPMLLAGKKVKAVFEHPGEAKTYRKRKIEEVANFEK
ncbi:8-oxo-dGTP diphosphatase [Patescibacteria group bacterium]